ncbi:unnamed protein product [Phytomonas sp. Hart1]|nr:unnamed protein product [Phytomonas sp. Hart1]|eukprot:CCW71566.1 unnamed protein product [Phytomonas sp. isolate Hart1]
MASFFDKPMVSLLRGQSLAPISAVEALEGKKYILVYFSAHWCPPCRMFTPVLRTFYEKSHAEKNFEVVFVSLDQSAEKMRAYMEGAHGDWLALPFDEAKVVGKAWMTRYNFQTIPTLLVFQNPRTTPSGEGKKEWRLVTQYARDLLDADPKGEGFPWPNGDAEVREYYRVLKRNVLITVLVLITLGVCLYRFFF